MLIQNIQETSSINLACHRTENLKGQSKHIAGKQDNNSRMTEESIQSKEKRDSKGIHSPRLDNGNLKDKFPWAYERNSSQHVGQMGQTAWPVQGRNWAKHNALAQTLMPNLSLVLSPKFHTQPLCWAMHCVLHRSYQPFPPCLFLPLHQVQHSSSHELTQNWMNHMKTHQYICRAGQLFSTAAWS